MLADLKPYAEIRDTGVEWLGEVPAHWDVRRLAQFGTLSKGSGGNKDDEKSDGVPCIRYGDLYTTHHNFIQRSRSFISNEKVAEYTPTRFDDVLFASSGETMDEIGKSAANVMQADACCGGDVIIFRPTESVDARYLGYVMDCRPVAAQKARMGRGITVMHVYGAQLKYLVIPLPPLMEQTAIARFLDHADRRIRHYIRAKQKLIALLEEQKQTVISEAVTGRMDIRTDQPYRAYKPSGVDWLKDVPQHWERRRLKTLLRSVDQRSRTGEEPLLSLRRDHGVVVYAEHFSRPPQARSLVGFKLVATGQLVVNRMQANNGLVFCSSFDGLVSPDYSVFETKKALQMEFLSDLLRTPEYLAHFRRSATGLGTGTAGFLRLYDDRFLDTVIFLPPEDEQTMVLRELSNRVATINTLIDTERRALQQINEYRSCLVAEVTTGKVDVREAVVSIAEGDPVKVEDNQEVALRRDAKSGLHGSDRVAQEM